MSSTHLSSQPLAPLQLRQHGARDAGWHARRTEDGKIRLVVLFESVEAGVKLAGAAVGLYDEKGRLTRWTADGAELAPTPVTAGIIVAPGRYRLRVATVDATGRAGTVDTQVSAELTDAPPVKLSGMVLGVADARGAFSPRLQFAGEKGAFGYLEIYGVTPGAQLKVVQELANSPDGPPLVSDETPITRGRPLTCGSHLRDSPSTRSP